MVRVEHPFMGAANAFNLLSSETVSPVDESVYAAPEGALVKTPELFGTTKVVP